ncbi:MAG: phosphatase PAP2 family protein, partial [Candidatus Amesbacteria bacterium]|nr:phosphatase PAP2 family protein [Candidatus Amesbacteria bacterium]
MDYFLLHWIQGITPRSWDWLFSWFSVLGRFEVISIFVFLFLWLGQKNIFKVYLGFFWYFLGLVLEFLAKTMFYHPPPPITLNRTINVLSLPGIHIESDFSFPSGHVYRMTYLALISSFYFLKTKNYFGVTVSCFLLLLMFYSRISLAEHWPSDVIGGVILAIVMLKVTFSSFQRKFYI